MAFRKTFFNPTGITLALSLLTGCGGAGSAVSADSSELGTKLPDVVASPGTGSDSQLPPTNGAVTDNSVVDETEDPGTVIADGSGSGVEAPPTGNPDTPQIDTPEVDVPVVDPTVAEPTVFPRDGATGVITSEVITAEFPSTAFASDTVTEFVVSSNGSAVDGIVGRDGEKVTFTPTVALEKGATYTAQVVALGTKAVTNEPVTINRSWRFTTVNSGSPEIVLYNDFNDRPTGNYSEADIRRSWNVIGAVVGADQNRFSIVDAADKSRGKVLRIKFEGNQRGVENGGVQWKTDIGKHDELYVSFWLKFEDNFNFVIGGKVPGLRGGRPLGKVKPNGRDRFSGRMMWRDQGKVVQYVYHPDQPAQAGDEMDWNLKGQRFFQPGKWHRVETRIKLNVPGKRNGIIQSWFDGKLALDRRNIRFRDINSLKIDIFDFSTFFGGGSDKWKTKKQEYAYYDDIIVSTKPIAH